MATVRRFLLTTHYMEEAEQLCDRVAIMDHGKILALDTPDKLKHSVGIDTIVTVKSTGDQDLLAADPRKERRGGHQEPHDGRRSGAARTWR
jgi:ABC-2 type transport system ATP-binding protein